MLKKASIKRVLGEVPLAAELYWQLWQYGIPPGRGFKLNRAEKRLPEWASQAEAARLRLSSSIGSHPRHRLLIFSTLRFWIEHAILMGLAMAGLGHEVTFAYLPYAKWQRPLNRFDLRRQNIYARHVLKKTSHLMYPLSLLDVKIPLVEDALSKLPRPLAEMICEVSVRDVQYTLQLEEVDREDSKTPTGRLYHLRLARNAQAALAALTWLQALAPERRPDVLLTPNGSILEMGAIYQVARFLGIPVVTYEFGEQRGRIWLARNSEVMLQETDDLWKTRSDSTLNPEQWELIRELYVSRQNARLWENFSRLWQGVPRQGGDRVRQALGLDSRPLIVLPANVIGDSLTLGRQIFTQTMTEWLVRTVQFFAQRSDVQLVVRIHPGERYITGPSVAQVVRNALSNLPSHIRLVEALDPINTYDLLEVADLGLVYTTTVGMEIAMSGIPVIVAGKTHYRGKGFTLDPDTWETYFQLIDQILPSPQAHRLSREQVDKAWAYAYCFFFEYPCPFPWHLLHFWKELDTWSLERVLSDEGQAIFGNTFRYLAGEERRWNN